MMNDKMDIKLGYLIRDGKPKNLVTLPWDNIGVLVVGRPGSGKSHVIASILTQYALKGADLVVAEYNADRENPQSLLYRIRHLDNAMLRPTVTSGSDIVELIQWVKRELMLRQTGQSPRTPLIVVLDEFFQFAASVKAPESVNVQKQGDARSDEGETITKRKEPTFWEDLLSSQTDMRKNNIRLILAAQETASTATSNLMRQVRDMFRFKLIMNLSPKGADLIGVTDRESQRIIDKLKPGRIFYNGSIIRVPFPINPEWIDACYTRIQPKENKFVEKTEPIKNDWTDTDLEAYLDMLFKQQGSKPKIIRYDIRSVWHLTTDKDVIELLLASGWSKNRIEQLFSMARSSLRQLVKEIEMAKDLPHSEAE